MVIAIVKRPDFDVAYLSDSEINSKKCFQNAQLQKPTGTLELCMGSWGGHFEVDISPLDVLVKHTT